MSSLFSHLWRHCSKETKPKENFFSDIVAELFKTYPEFLFQWLGAIGVSLKQGTEPEISIQKAFRLQNGEQGVYDLSIRVQNGAGDHLIVVESKIDSTAMWGQLEKYEKDLTHRLEQTPPDGLGATLRLTSPEMEIRLQIRHGKAPADGEERRGQSPLSSGKSKAIRKPEIAIQQPYVIQKQIQQSRKEISAPYRADLMKAWPEKIKPTIMTETGERFLFLKDITRRQPQIIGEENRLPPFTT